MKIDPLLTVVSYKTKVSVEHWTRLDMLSIMARTVTNRMLQNRNVTSSKFYKEVPCVIAKALSRKYQRNPKCKSVTRLCIPVCGDKGKQVKLTGSGIRIPALFGKGVVPCQFPLPITGWIRQVELFKRSGDWFMSYSYNTQCARPIKTARVIGVDRNSVGNIATIADPSSGSVRSFGFNADRWKYNLRRRKARIMSQGRKRLASRLRRKQSCRTRNENHRVSKGIVDYAATHRCALSLENLKHLTKGAKHHADTRQWAHAQLLGFIKYKAALRGVPIVFVNPAYTSQDCSRCGQRNKPNGKSYSCASCGHKSHRDTNAAFNIAALGAASFGIGKGLSVPLSRSIDGPLSGKAFAI